MIQNPNRPTVFGIRLEMTLVYLARLGDQRARDVLETVRLRENREARSVAGHLRAWTADPGPSK